MKREVIVLAIVLCTLAIFITLKFTLFTKEPTKPIEPWTTESPKVITIVINESIDVLRNEYWHYFKLDYPSKYPRWLIRLRELAESNVTLDINEAVNILNSLGYSVYSIGELPITISWSKGSLTIYSDNIKVGVLNKIAIDEGFFNREYARIIYNVLGYGNFENNANTTVPAWKVELAKLEALNTTLSLNKALEILKALNINYTIHEHDIIVKTPIGSTFIPIINGSVYVYDLSYVAWCVGSYNETYASLVFKALNHTLSNGTCYVWELTLWKSSWVEVSLEEASQILQNFNVSIEWSGSVKWYVRVPSRSVQYELHVVNGTVSLNDVLSIIGNITYDMACQVYRALNISMPKGNASIAEVLKIHYPQIYGKIKEVFGINEFIVKEFRLGDWYSENASRIIILRIYIPKFIVKLYELIENGALPIVELNPYRYITPSDPLIKRIAQKLKNIVKDDHGYEEWRAANLAVQIAQEIEYSPEDVKPTFPVLVLVRGIGDCDVKTFLAITLLKAMNIKAGHIYINMTPPHVMPVVAVELPPWIKTIWSGPVNYLTKIMLPNGTIINSSMRFYSVEVALSTKNVINHQGFPIEVIGLTGIPSESKDYVELEANWEWKWNI